MPDARLKQLGEWLLKGNLYLITEKNKIIQGRQMNKKIGFKPNSRDRVKHGNMEHYVVKAKR